VTSILESHTDEVADLTVPASAPARELRRRIESRDAVIAIIGLGYVGLPLAVSYAEAGFRVVGIDLDGRRVEGLRDGISPVEDIPDVRLAPIVAPLPELYAPRPHNGDQPAGFLAATSDFDVLSIADAVIICVPTPLSHTKDPDVSYIMAAADQIARRLHPGMLVVLESTTYPGTTEELVLPLLENPQAVLRRRHDDRRQSPRSPLVVGRDFFLAFSPERIDPGRRDHTIQTTPKVVGGTTPTCLSLATALYGSIVNHVVQVSNPKAAEMVKLLENTFRSVNIGLVNELAMWCDKLDVDVWEVIEAAATKPFGVMPFRPGPGLGGHCIPIDPLYLAWKLRSLDYPARFITLASEINMSMPHHVLAKVATALNDDAKAVRGSRVLVLGVTRSRLGETLDRFGRKRRLPRSVCAGDQGERHHTSFDRSHRRRTGGRRLCCHRDSALDLRLGPHRRLHPEHRRHPQRDGDDERHPASARRQALAPLTTRRTQHDSPCPRHRRDGLYRWSPLRGSARTR
jgi:UDP-N-acetyl-D-glucosamine dehydrogenase